MRARGSRFGYYARGARSTTTFTFFAPLAGFTTAEDVLAPPSSMISGANVWRENNAMRPRARLTLMGQNAEGSSFGATPSPDVINGAFLYQDLDGSAYPVVMSKDTVSFLESPSWMTMNYASGLSNLPPEGGENDHWFGDSVYLARRDLNIGIFTNGVDPMFAWGGPSDGTAFSTLTEAPIVKDVTVFDNSAVGWNVQLLSSSSRFVTRVAWSTPTDPEDWSDINAGAGYEDLIDMRGFGTRIFTLGDEMILATNRELWRGRRIGGPYRFQFSPLERNLGMPYPHAACKTCNYGIFWLNSDYMIYNLSGGQVQPVGQPILQRLRDTLQDFDKAFFAMDEERQQISLFYSVSAGSYPTRAFTLHLDSQTWTPHTYTHQLTTYFPTTYGTAANTWAAYTGAFSTMTQSWNELLGITGGEEPAFASSNGTTFLLSSTASVDGESDSSQVVEAQLVTGGLFTGDPTMIKFINEIRVDSRTDSASSLSVRLSGNLGGAFVTNDQRAFSLGSNSSQIRAPLAGVSGQYHVIALSSEQTGWNVTRVYAKGYTTGQAI